MTRREDPDLLRGQAVFTDDVALDDPLYVAFLRSPQQSGRIARLDLSQAQDAPGVAAVHCAADLPPIRPLGLNPTMAVDHALPFTILAADEVGCIGAPIAAVLAASQPQATDGAEMIGLDLDDTQAPPPLRVAGGQWRIGTPDDAFATAPIMVEAKVAHPRLAPASMEPRAIAIRYDRDTDTATIYHSTQTPHRTRSELAGMLQVDPARLRVIAPAVGGAFGMKASLYPEEVFAVWAALHHRRSVKWIATRSEDFLSATHGRGLTSRGRLALDAEGHFLALEARIAAPVGTWLPNSALIPGWNAARILPSGYRVPHLDLSTEVTSHPLPPVGIYRGAGRPEANALMERLIDEAAAATGLDPFEIRRRNLLTSAELPHAMPVSDTLDSGDYPALLDQLGKAADHGALKARRDDIRAQGRLAGLGLAFYVEPSGNGWESARVTLAADSTALVESGSSSQGQGRETAYAQIAADALGLDPAQITVRAGDSGTCPEGIGALASRATAIGGSAVLEACKQVIAQREAGAALPIAAELRYENKGQAWGYGAYLVLVEIDRDTGQMQVLEAHGIDDAGRIVNPILAEGQVIGGFAQGLGEAMLERIVLDADGQLLTGSFMDYAMPRATDIPPLTLSTSEMPSPMNTLGAKGLGEAGTIGAPIAILNAASDALRPLGVTGLQMPLTPARLWQAMYSPDKGPMP